MGVPTGAHAYTKYGFESAFGTEQSTKDKVFGIEEKISGWSWQNNQKVLSGLNEVFPSQYAYGQNAGRYTVDFILSNPWFLKLLFDTIVTSGSGLKTHTYTATKACQTLSHEIGMDLNTNQVRVALGALCNSVSIRGSVNELMRCSAEIIYGKEKAVSTTLATDTVHDNISFPYTFEHGSIELPNGTVLAEVQSVDMTFNQNAELLYEFGGADAVNGIRKRFDITGRLNMTLKDNVTLGYINGRAEVASMKLKFSNGASGNAEKSIEFNGTKIGLSEMAIGGIEPHEVIFEDISFQWGGCSVIAKNAENAL